jgi:hypothetical protein
LQWRIHTYVAKDVNSAGTSGRHAAIQLAIFVITSALAWAADMVTGRRALLLGAHNIPAKKAPLFPNREWQIAGGFGLAHGLAFSESLTGLNLAPPDKALAIFGFNTGVEAAQLLIMSAALPLLYFSRFPAFHGARRVAMALVAMLAALWIGERAFGLGVAEV